jgi:hypothetical protein
LQFAFESEEEEDMDDDPDELEAESGSASLKIFVTWSPGEFGRRLRTAGNERTIIR